MRHHDDLGPLGGIGAVLFGTDAVARALIIVDFQNDFCPGGALAVPAGDEIAGRLNELAGSGDYDLVVATRD